MSSYVISKKYYVQVAGAIVGLSNALYREPLWIYNYKDNRNFNEDDYYTLFTWMYDANAISVQKQYGDAKRETDDNEYKKEFDEYKKIGKQYVYNSREKELVKSIADFFRSIKYQIEDDDLSRKVNCYLNKIQVEIVNKTLLKGETSCWGDFEIEMPDNKVQVIM